MIHNMTPRETNLDDEGAYLVDAVACLDGRVA